MTALALDAPPAFAAKARYTLETLLGACGGPPAQRVAYPSSALEGSEAAWAFFASGMSGAPPRPGADGLLDFGDGARDLVASAFYRLARVEERAPGPRDRHGRYPAGASLDDPERPAVDLLLERFREAVDAPARAAFTVALTHDVDSVGRLGGLETLRAAGRRLARATVRRRGGEARAEARGLLGAPLHRLRGSDPDWSFARIAELERAHGARSTYFVIAAHRHPLDGARPEVYARMRPRLVAELAGRGDEVALHASYTSGGDAALLGAERRRLEDLLGEPVRGVRFHYLRHEAHESLPLLDRLGFAYDSSQGYAERPGLRAGFSFPYRPYDLAADRPLALLELPLAVMDATLADERYLDLSPARGLARSLGVLEHVARIGGTVAVLWHNNRFDAPTARGWDGVYAQILRFVAERGGRLTSAAEALRPLR